MIKTHVRLVFLLEALLAKHILPLLFHRNKFSFFEGTPRPQSLELDQDQHFG